MFERQPAAHPDCIPDAAHLILGDIRATLRGALSRLPDRAPWSTTTSAPAMPRRMPELADWIASALPPLTKPGAVILSDQSSRRPAAAPSRHCQRRFPRGAISYTVGWVDPLGAEMRRAARLVRVIVSACGEKTGSVDGDSRRLHHSFLGRARHDPMHRGLDHALRRQHGLRRDALWPGAPDLRCRHRVAPARPRDGLQRRADPLAPLLHPHPHGPRHRPALLPAGLRPAQLVRVLERPSRRPGATPRRRARAVDAAALLPGAARHHACLHRLP